MNPETNKLERLRAALDCDEFNRLFNEALDPDVLLRPDGTLVPKHWSVYEVNELVTIKNYTFRVAFIGESYMVVEPASPVVISGEPSAEVKDGK